MAINTAGALVEVLRKTRLLQPGQIAQIPHLVRDRNDPRGLAKVLVQQGWLTIYQINQLLAGKGQELVFGPYHILDLLGKGGLSTVFKARHTEYNWIVALKILNPEALDNEEGRRQFLWEMEAMTLLDHPNIVQFCDVDQAGETYYYAMEYVDGTDLGKYVGLAGKLPIAEACAYIHQTAEGLQHAHEHNLIHRDIKPVNLLLTQASPARKAFSTRESAEPPRPLIKILDWGLAALRLPRGQQKEAADGANMGLLGTADYLAPEQASSPEHADIRSDIYSLGCTLYFFLAARPPFPDGNLVQKLMQHREAQPKPLSDFRSDVPEELAAVLTRMMAKKPEDRFQTPAALALALKPFVTADLGQLQLAREILGLGKKLISVRDQTPLPSRLR